MKMIQSKWILLALLLLCSNALIADSYEPSHSCFKPNMQVTPSSRAEAKKLNDQIDAYKQCILDFVDDQNAAITYHQQGAQTAIDEWNRFVKQNGLLLSK